MGNPKISLRSFVLDCRDPKKLSRFYAELLGGKLDTESENWISVVIEGTGARLSFQRDRDYQGPVWPGEPGDQQQMAHIDFTVENEEAAVNYALSLGAVLPETQYCDRKGSDIWTTLLDPEGHPFCLCS